MRTKVTLALLFLNVVLFGYILYLRPTDQGDLEARSRLVLPAGATDLREIEITVGSDTTRLLRRGEQWCLATPIDWPANPHAVEHILTELQSLKHENSFTVASLALNNLSLADYGLEKPAMTVTLTAGRATPAEEARVYVLKVGNTTKVENRLYVLSTDGTRIHVVSRSLAESLTLPLDQLRAANLFTIPDFEVRNFSIQPAAAVSARTRIRRDGTRWTMENPVQARANATAVRSTLAQLAGLQVENFISQPLAPDLAPSSATSLRITLEGNNRSEALLLGAAVPRENGQPTRSYYGQFEWKVDGERKSAVFIVSIPQPLLESLRTAQEALRETRILEMDTASLTAITLRAPAQPDLVLQRLESAVPAEGHRWQLVRRAGDAPPVTQPADPEAVKLLLERLAALNATRFVTDAPGSADLESMGFNRPERTLVLQALDPRPASPARTTSSAQPSASAETNQQAVTLELGVGADPGTRAFARLDSARYIYEVDAEILGATKPDPRLWRDRVVQELPAGARISALRITENQTGALVAEARFAAVPAGAQPEPSATQELSEVQRRAWSSLATSLRRLRARSFVAEHWTPDYTLPSGEQPWKYRLMLEITLQSGAGEQVSTRNLELSERVGGTQQVAGSAEPEINAIFELDQDCIDSLWTLVYGNRDPGPQSAAPQSPQPPAPALPAAPAPAP